MKSRRASSIVMFSIPANFKATAPAMNKELLKRFKDAAKDNLNEFTEMYYQLTAQERQQLTHALMIEVRLNQFSFNEAMNIVAHANSMAISERNIDITVKDKNGLEKNADGCYIVENFPICVAVECTKQLNKQPQYIEQCIKDTIKESSKRAIVKR